METATKDAPVQDDAKPTDEQPSDAGKVAGEGNTPVGRRRLTLGIVALLGVALIAAVVTLSILLAQKSDRVDEMNAATADATKAQNVALDYAVKAASMDYKDLGSWDKRLVEGTSPELTAKLTDAAKSMEQVITPLQWTSSASPIAAQLKSHNGSVYIVTAFVSVMTKNAQAPDGVQSTATYTVTLDKSKNWLITDVGGVDAPLGQK
ncbi:hypothetical protein A5788_19390 [Gordonia sp. 852002-50816_SCH5313054-c]|nr:hypothetical protein A5786_11725 [Gordonia sp. 852002-50816_SCH5313054-a]OBC13342.1 hypothetical protein A5788_19390 [Gordonia sp. 852002-50816_SCH5313054-c]